MTNSTYKLNNLDKLVIERIHIFEELVKEATHFIYGKMESRDEIDVFHMALDVLFFRNSHLFEAILFLLDNKYSIVTEFLVRSQFEGVVIFEWCMVDPKDRALRFRKTSMEGTLFLIEEGFLNVSQAEPDALRTTIAELKERKTKNLPNFRQMLESVETLQHGYTYNLYRYLSKKAHCAVEDWNDYLICNDKFKIINKDDAHPMHIASCRATTCHLQMKNICLVGKHDKWLTSDKNESVISYWEQELWPLLDVYEQKRENAGKK